MTAQHRHRDSLDYADGHDACSPVFVGGPVALAWSHFGPAVRERVQTHYLAAIERWRSGAGYRIPAEYLSVVAQRPPG